MTSKAMSPINVMHLLSDRNHYGKKGARRIGVKPPVSPIFISLFQAVTIGDIGAIIKNKCCHLFGRGVLSPITERKESEKEIYRRIKRS